MKKAKLHQLIPNLIYPNFASAQNTDTMNDTVNEVLGAYYFNISVTSLTCSHVSVASTSKFNKVTVSAQRIIMLLIESLH